MFKDHIGLIKYFCNGLGHLLMTKTLLSDRVNTCSLVLFDFAQNPYYCVFYLGTEQHSGDSLKLKKILLQ